jgi:hypothetical protein
LADKYVAPSQSNVIQLNGTSASFNGSSGVTIKDGTVTITKAGTYTVQGTLSDGRIEVDADGAVTLVLNGMSVTSSTGAPFVVTQADEVVVSLAQGTENTFTDASTRADSDSASACLYSKDDLWLCGRGTLTVNANYNNGIQSKDVLTVVDGTYVVTSVDDALVGKDAVVMGGGTYTLNAQGDGIKSTNSEDASLGTVTLLNGTFAITAGNDAVQAETILTVSDGTYSIVTGGGADNAAKNTKNEWFGRGSMGSQGQTTTSQSDSESMKGLKASTLVDVKGGTFTLNTCDDAVHSNGNVSISGGTFAIRTGDDAFHADDTLAISDGNIAVSQSYEGLEGLIIEIRGGTIDVTSSDDGINVAGGDGSGQFGFAWDSFSNKSSTSASSILDSDTYLSITGGTIVVNASGDGIDINGSGVMTGGNVTVYGPTDGGNGGLDYDGTFLVNGGQLVCFGSMQMAMAPSAASTQPSLSVYASMAAGTKVRVCDANGKEILSATTQKTAQHVAISSPDLTTGQSVTVYAGDTQVGTVTLAAGVNSVGSQSGGMGGMNGGMMGNGARPGGRNSSGNDASVQMPDANATATMNADSSANGQPPELPSGAQGGQMPSMPGTQA